MAGDDDDTIYVDVAARLDEGAAEKATGKLRDKLKSAGRGLGKVIGSDISREIAETIWDAGGDDIKKVGVNWGKSLTKGIGDAIGGSWGDIAKNLGDSLLEGTADTIGDQIKGKLKGVKDSVDDVKKSFADISKGDTEKKLQGVADLLKKIEDNGIDTHGAADGLQKIDDKAKSLKDQFSGLKNTIIDLGGGFGTLELMAPGVAAALSDMAGPLALILGANMLAYNWGVGHVDKDLQAHPPFVPNMPAIPPHAGIPNPGAPVPGLSRPGDLPKVHGEPSLGGIPMPGLQPGVGGPAHTTMPPQGSPSIAPPSIAPPDTGGLPAHTSSAITGGGSQGVRLVDVTSGGGTPGFPGMGSGTVNDDLRSALQRAGVDPRMYPLLQGFAKTEGNNPSGVPTLGFTDSQAGSTLDQHARALAAQIQARQSVAGSFPANGTPQEQASWMATVVGQNGVKSDWQGNAQPSRQSYVNSIMSGFGGLPTSGGGAVPFGSGASPTPSAGGGARPAGLGISGMPGLPGVGAYSPPPTQGNSYSPQKQQGLGHGQGLGVSGGAIGMAEQAGSMAAGAMSFGGGAIAAQMAEQEMNLAIQKGGQMAATAAMILPETFGLSGGQMGAPSVGQNGWYKKIVGSLIGQQTSIPNTAGATQPPKDPKQKDEGDPLSGQPGGKPGPSGHQDDPIHVKQAPSPQGAPQGQTTSAMNTTGVMSGTTL